VTRTREGRLRPDPAQKQIVADTIRVLQRCLPVVVGGWWIGGWPFYFPSELRALASFSRQTKSIQLGGAPRYSLSVTVNGCV